MKLRSLAESVAHLKPEIQEWVIREAPHFPIVNVPQELYPLTLGTFVDFGIDDADPDNALQWARAFASGVRIPGTNLKIKALPLSVAVIEQSDGTEPSLPENWRQYIQVTNANLKERALLWFGNKVRPDRRPPDDEVAAYFEADEDGFVRKENRE